LAAISKEGVDSIGRALKEMCVFHEVKGASWRISKGTKNKAALFTELGLPIKT
jgi:hypothetical protein